MSDGYVRLLMLLPSVIGILLMAVIGAIAAAIVGQFFGALIAILGIIGIASVAFVLRPRTDMGSRIFLASITLLGGAFAATAYNNHFRLLVIHGLASLLRRYGVDLPDMEEAASPNLFYALCITDIAICILWVCQKPRLITQPPLSGVAPLGNNADINTILKNPGFQSALERYCTALTAYLGSYDNQVNWSDREYLPLEATVESEGTPLLRPRLVANLVEAIRRDRKSEVFVVIGDPGSGKSVSLRNFVRRLAVESPVSGVIPVYINLREFPPRSEVTQDSIINFTMHSALRQTGRDGHQLFTEWYDLFRKKGLLFFIFDSFDEMPQVLDADDGTESHRNICQAFDSFIRQEIQSCRVVIASRRFRSPTGIQGTRLYIHPFTRKQIHKFLTQRSYGYGFSGDDLIRTIYRDRSTMIVILLNPFTADMLADFARTHGGQLPLTTYMLFKSFIDTRLLQDTNALRQHLNLPITLLPAAFRTLAWSMYNGDSGLECESNMAIAALDSLDAGAGATLLDGMKYTRLVRTATDSTAYCAFSHRRIGEFFVVEALRERDAIPSLSSIPTDSRWRDVLVMYYGVASSEERSRATTYCCQLLVTLSEELVEGRFPAASPAIHALRFLNDADLRSAVIASPYYDYLRTLVVGLLTSSDPLVAKLAAEQLCLLADIDQLSALQAAFKSRYAWVRNNAIGACRYVVSCDALTMSAVLRHVETSDPYTQLITFSEVDFGLSLSPAMTWTRRALRASLGVTITSHLLFVVAVVIASIASIAWRSAVPLGSMLFFTVVPLSTMAIALHQRRSELFGRNFPFAMVGCVVGLPMCIEWMCKLYYGLDGPRFFPDINKNVSPGIMTVQMLFVIIWFVCCGALFAGVSGWIRICCAVWSYGIVGTIVKVCSLARRFALLWLPPIAIPIAIAMYFNQIAFPIFIVIGVFSLMLVAICATIVGGVHLLRLLRDAARLKAGVPREVSASAMVIQVAAFRTSYYQCKYVRLLRTVGARKQNPLGDEWTENESQMRRTLIDRRCVEEWGKLREYWAGLSR